MRRPDRPLASLAALALAAALASAACIAQPAPARLPVRLFTVLPDDFRHPESLAVDAATGAVYVGSFDAREPESLRRNQILRLSASGEVEASRPLGPTPVTGLAFAEGHVYFLNFGASRLQRLPADFDAQTGVVDVAAFGPLTPSAPPERRIANPDGSHDTLRFGAAGFAAINGLVFAADGTAYVSDSFQGAIYRIDKATRCAPCRVEVLVRDPLLATAGSLPFGANGLALDEDKGQLYVNNAGDGRVLRMHIDGGPITVLAESIHGADGLLLHSGWLWVAANQADAVIALDLDGRERVRAGQFLGLRPDGSPDGLLFPAATAVLGRRMIVANLALPLTAKAGDEWEEEVVRWNLMQFDLPGRAAR